jgi:copper(I)-binding protein
MKWTSIIVTLAATVGLSAALQTAQADPVQAGALTIDHVWARATPGTNSAAFLAIRNDGDSPDRLMAASSPAAKMVHLHSSMMEGDVMQMRAIDGVAIPPHGQVELAPGGLHIMLMDLSRPLAVGDSLPLALTFEKAGRVTVSASVEAAGAKQAAPAPAKSETPLTY